ncbi:MAG: fibronectin type III domain-containing protein [Thermoanaerobaculaceae bacterium]|nr:fibronectin type III domain-containing protein [Thermoanaerobaculaceae bacterium]
MTPRTRVGTAVSMVAVGLAMLALGASPAAAEICTSVTPVLEERPPASGYKNAPYSLTIGPEKLAACTNLSYWFDFGGGTDVLCSAPSWSKYELSQGCTYVTPGGPYRWTAKVSRDGGQTVLWSETGEITILDPPVDCKTPALVVMASPPPTATSRAYYPLRLGPSGVASCRDIQYWLDFGFPATPQCPQYGWTGSLMQTCPYPAPGTYIWTAKARVPDGAEISRSGTTTVHDCSLTCDGLVPATGQVGVPIAFNWTATPSHCTPRWWVRFGWMFTPTSGVDDSCAKDPCLFTFNQPGTYNWSLVTQARQGGPALYKECLDTGTITIGGDVELKVGNLTFKAASMTQNGTTYTLTGPVRVNEVLRFPGQVVFTGNPASGKGELSTNADAQVATTPATTTILSGASQVGYSVDGTTIPGRLTPRLLPGLAALDFSLDGIPLYLMPSEPLGVSTAGVRLNATMFIGTADFHLAVLRLQLGLLPGQPLSLLPSGTGLVNGNGVPGVEVVSVPALALDAGGHLSGRLEVGFPLIEVTSEGNKTTLQMDMRNRGGCIDELELAPTTVRDLRVRMGSPWLPFLYAGWNGSTQAITGICSRPVFAPLFAGSFAFHCENCQSYFRIHNSIWAYEPPRTMRLLRGEPTFLNLLATDGSAAWVGLGSTDVLFLKRQFHFRYGGTDIIDGTLRAGVVSWKEQDVSSVWRARGDLVGPFVFDERCPCPAGAGIDCEAARIGLLERFEGQQTFPDRRFELVASGSRTSSEFDAIFVGRGVFPGLTEADVRLVRKAREDGAGENRCWFGSNLAARPTTKPASALEVRAAAVERTTTLAKVEELAIFSVKGQSSTLPAIYLRNPAGQKITPGTVGSFPTVTYASDATTKLALFTVASAAAGTWTLGEDNLPESEVVFTVLAPLPPPVTAFTQVGASGTSRSITVSVTPPSADTRVSLYFSRTHDGLPEGVIAADLPATPTVTATWDTTPLPSGTYYLFAVTDDGRNAPVTTFHATPITIDVGGLAAPTNVQAVRTGETVTLTWTPSTSPAVIGYTVMYTGEPDQPGYPESAPALGPNGATITDLGYSRSYRLCVVGYDLAGNMTPASTSVTVPPGKGRARRHLGE